MRAHIVSQNNAYREAAGRDMLARLVGADSREEDRRKEDISPRGRPGKCGRYVDDGDSLSTGEDTKRRRRFVDQLVVASKNDSHHHAH